MKDKEYSIFTTTEYDEWFDEQQAKSRVQILDRLSNIQEHGHFGDHKDVGEDVWELKWANGRRVYYAYIPEKKILLILGGNKNGQDKDIRQAKKILLARAFFAK
jgi:putative addiction module killer protein